MTKRMMKLICGMVMVMLGILSGCSTIKGVGEDLDTLGRGMAKHHETPNAVQQDNSRK